MEIEKMATFFKSSLSTIVLASLLTTAIALDTDDTITQGIRDVCGKYFGATVPLSNLSAITTNQISSKLSATDFSSITTLLDNAATFFAGTAYSNEITGFQSTIQATKDAITAANAALDTAFSAITSLTKAQMLAATFDAASALNSATQLNASAKYGNNAQIATQANLINLAKNIQDLRTALKATNAGTISGLSTLLTTQKYIDASVEFRKP